MGSKPAQASPTSTGSRRLILLERPIYTAEAPRIHARKVPTSRMATGLTFDFEVLFECCRRNSRASTPPNINGDRGLRCTLINKALNYARDWPLSGTGTTDASNNFQGKVPKKKSEDQSLSARATRAVPVEVLRFVKDFMKQIPSSPAGSTRSDS